MIRGVFWRPVFNLLEGHFEMILVNAQHMKAVPGHKTDVKDSEWIADLLRHGLLQASFIPPKPLRGLRDLVRYRKTLVQQRAQQVVRVHKVLETANIKLTCVASNVVGKSGRAMLDGLPDGESNASSLAELVRGRLRAKLPALREALESFLSRCIITSTRRAKLPALREALEGQVEATHRVLLRHLLGQIDTLSGEIEPLDSEMAPLLWPYESILARLVHIPGVGFTAAVAIVAEIGSDMSYFPSAKHLASWAGVAPGNRESAGKRRRAGTTKGNTHVRAVLAEVAWALSHRKDTYLAAQYHRLARRIGKQRAIVAVSHSVLVIIYHMLARQEDYHELGAHFLEDIDTTRQRDAAVRRLQDLGYSVSLQEKEVVSP